LQGDFKTGKRLNMKKVISFIASNYRNDKIWLRRTLPSKRDYKILIAIDDSLSMQENSNLGLFSLEAMVALTEALNRLEVGKVAVDVSETDSNYFKASKRATQPRELGSL